MKLLPTLPILTCLLLSCIHLNAQGKLDISPEKPVAGDTVLITYQADKQLNTSPGIQLHFTYSNFFELPGSMPLAEKNGIWKTSFKLPPYGVFATFVIKVGDSTIKPSDKKHFEITVYNDQKQRVKNSYLYQGYSLGAQEGRSNQLSKNQAALYAEELKHYPDNYEAKLRVLAYQITKAEDAQKPALYTKANKIIAEKFYTDPGNMGYTNRTTMGYLIMGENSRLDSLREVIKKDYPLSEAGYELRIADLTSLKDTSAMIAGLEKMLQDENAGNSKFLEKAHEALFHYFTSIKDEKKSLHHLSYLNKEFTPYTPENLKSQAEILYKNGLAPETALNLAEEAFRYVDTFPISLIRYFPETGYLPAYVSREQRRHSVNKVTGQLKSLMGLIRLQTGRNTEADQLISEALKFSEDEETLKNAGTYFMAVHHYDQAFTQYYKLSFNNADDTLSYRLMVANYEKWKGNLSGIEQHEAILKQHWQEEMNRQLAKEIISQPLPDVVSNFVDLKGRPLTPDLIRNKIVIMDFWATWCVPCIKAMPYMDEVYKNFQNDSSVVFMIVNSGSQNELKDAQNWWGNKKFSFPVYYNTDRTIGEKMGFNLIPATFIIDQHNQIRFKTLGFEESGMVRKITAQIELLKK